MNTLTKRQAQILGFIEEYLQTYGYAPTLDEIKIHFKLRSVATVHKHLAYLERKGYITRRFNHSRAIQLIKLSVSKDQQAKNVVEVPLLGFVAAGQPIEAIADQESIAIPPDMLGKKETYVLRVRGDSMIDEQIRDGDFIIVEATQKAENGEVVVALVDNELVTVKKFYNEPPDKVRLQPANPSMQPLIYPSDAVTIQGRVLGVLRKYT